VVRAVDPLSLISSITLVKLNQVKIK